MKKLICVLGLLLTIPAFGATMCATSDTVAVVLDPTINGTSYTPTSGNQNDMVNGGHWTATFSYGKLYGVAACLTTGGSLGTANTSITAVGGELQGGNCWCKITHPVSSAWVFSISYSASYCANYCAGDCGRNVRTSSAMRAGLFGSLAP